MSNIMVLIPPLFMAHFTESHTLSWLKIGTTSAILGHVRHLFGFALVIPLEFLAVHPHTSRGR